MTEVLGKKVSEKLRQVLSLGERATTVQVYGVSRPPGWVAPTSSELLSKKLDLRREGFKESGLVGFIEDAVVDFLRDVAALTAQRGDDGDGGLVDGAGCQRAPRTRSARPAETRRPRR